MKTETELKQTWCPYADSRTRWMVETKLRGNFPAETACIGLACSQCVDCGAEVETAYSDDQPEGDGWQQREKGFPVSDRIWVRETGERNVYCGRNTGEALRQEVAGAIRHLMDAIHNININ